MSRGEKIFKRNDGKWEAKYVIEILPDGQEVYSSINADTYFKVKNKLDNILKDLIVKKSNNYNDTYFIFYAKEWLCFHRLGIKESSYSKYYQTVVNYINPYFNQVKLKDINTALINSFIEHLLYTRFLAPRTIKDILVVFKMITKHISDEHNVELKFKINTPKITKKPIRVLNENEFNSLNDFLLKDINLCKLGVLIVMSTGLRLGEICALKWKDIDLNNGLLYVEGTMQRIKVHDNDNIKTKIIVQSPKTESSRRTIPIPENLIPLLRKYCVNDSCYVLTGESDKIIEPRSLERIFKSYSRKIGIKDIHFHTLRHTFATMSVESGFEIKCLSEILGHSNIQTTLNKYVHTSFKSKQSHMDRFFKSNIKI